MIRFAVLAAAVALLLQSTALAAPGNDAFADAVALGPPPVTESLELAGATTEPGEPQFCNFLVQTSWYRLASTQPNAVLLDVSGSSFGVMANVYRAFSPGLGGLGFATCVGMNFGPSRTLALEAGVTYYIQAGSVSGGPATLNLAVTEIPAPANDDFADATAIGSVPFADVVDTTSATTEPGEPVPSCGFGGGTGGVWYGFTPTETVSVSASAGGSMSAQVAAYSGTSLASLTQLGCRPFGGLLTIRAVAGTTYWFQASGLFGSRGQLRFALDVAPAPRPGFMLSPSDPSSFDATRFFDSSFDPANVGFAAHAWDFGDGGSASGPFPTHTYAADGDYTVALTVTTQDGRTASVEQVVHVQTHDVAIVRFAVPARGTVGRTSPISVEVSNQRYAETVEVQLFRSIPGPAEYELVGTLRQLVPVAGKRRPTPFDFSYTFMADDAARGSVTFKAVARIVTARDALPANNTAVASTTRVHG